MARPISRLFCVLLLVSLSAQAEGPTCGAPARECELQILRMLQGRRYLGVTIEERDGLVVKTVHPKSPAMRAGLVPGDRFVAINGKPLKNASPRDFKQIIADARETGRLFMIIDRRGAFRKLEGRLEPYSKEQIAKIVAAHVQQSHTATADAH